MPELGDGVLDDGPGRRRIAEVGLHAGQARAGRQVTAHGGQRRLHAVGAPGLLGVGEMEGLEIVSEPRGRFVEIREKLLT